MTSQKNSNDVAWEKTEMINGNPRLARITCADLEILQNQDDKTLSYWAFELNCWRWPKELPNEEDPDIARTNSISTRRHALLLWIEEKIGMKEVLRTYWERCFYDMSEFEEFWRVNYEDVSEEERESYYALHQQKYVEK